MENPLEKERILNSLTKNHKCNTLTFERLSELLLYTRESTAQSRSNFKRVPVAPVMVLSGVS